uniref:Rx N-terminal domain-containing protein n=1 Tax=Ananas comosus var. bracteatus TaxID=296719 RepID=A0A6V7PGD0_ANACO|nr:unnamed protein product [Ananas comosus var. bracteatus]
MLIEAAGNSPHRDSLRGSLHSLEDAIYEVEDVLDLHDYNLLKQKVKNNVEGIVVCLESLPIIKDIIKKIEYCATTYKAEKELDAAREHCHKSKGIPAVLTCGN